MVIKLIYFSRHNSLLITLRFNFACIDSDFRGKIIQRIAQDFHKEEARKRAQTEHQAEREPERDNAREPEKDKEREPEQENEEESDRESPDTERIEREWAEGALDEIKEKEHASRNERAQEVVVFRSKSDSFDVTPTSNVAKVEEL